MTSGCECMAQKYSGGGNGANVQVGVQGVRTYTVRGYVVQVKRMGVHGANISAKAELASLQNGAKGADLQAVAFCGSTMYIQAGVHGASMQAGVNDESITGGIPWYKYADKKYLVM
jgi:hypothetical protein